MSTHSLLSPRAAEFRQAISDFIAERRELKLKTLSGEKASEAEAKYEYNTWIADAARRVGQIQAVTHVLKATHPDARGSSLYINPTTLPKRQEVGSHLLKADFQEDVVGNAAALDVYKFLKIEVEQQRLLDWLQVNDSDLLAALNSDEKQAQEWADAFRELVRIPESLVSHANAKQIYWCVTGDPVADENFHLLQVLFPSSFVHLVHEQLSAARFGQDNKEARQAFKAKKAHTNSYNDYQNLAIRKLGGTKPQNISQLNSERGGVNYLLASSPPIWNISDKKSYLGIANALQHFRRFEGVSVLVKRLVGLLKSDPERTIETRTKREEIEKALGQALANYGVAIANYHTPGWTRAPECALPIHQKNWLDGERAELPESPDHMEQDVEFRQAFEWKDWPDLVATDFALWLNAILRSNGLPVGDIEVKHWAKQAIVNVGWPVPVTRRAINTKEFVEPGND